MRHLVIGRRQKAPDFSAFHWSPHGCLITIGQHFVTTRVVHLPKRTETSLITESYQSRVNHQLLQLCTARTTWSDSDQAVRPCIAAKACWHCVADMLLLPPICVLIVALYPSSSASVSGNQILGSNHISVNDVTNTGTPFCFFSSGVAKFTLPNNV